MESATEQTAVDKAEDYYNSTPADEFYFNIWGGEHIHVGIYNHEKEPIKDASPRIVGLMASKLNLTPETKLLDLGSGYGGAARYLVKKYGCQITCLNLSETQNRRNRLMNDDQGLADRIEVVEGNFEEIPADDQQFDLAWSQDAILHSGRREKVLDEVNRVLKPGGEFIFTDPMQADDVPEGVLEPVLNRIHLNSLGSFEFYRQQALRLGWEEVAVTDHSPQLVNHYTRVRQELAKRREELVGKVSEDYIDRMVQGLGHWIDAGRNGHLAWGIMHFRKK